MAERCLVDIQCVHYLQHLFVYMRPGIRLLKVLIKSSRYPNCGHYKGYKITGRFLQKSVKRCWQCFIWVVKFYRLGKLQTQKRCFSSKDEKFSFVLDLNNQQNVPVRIGSKIMLKLILLFYLSTTFMPKVSLECYSKQIFKRKITIPRC